LGTLLLEYEAPGNERDEHKAEEHAFSGSGHAGLMNGGRL
jgi:hypothetical protein